MKTVLWSGVAVSTLLAAGQATAQSPSPVASLVDLSIEQLTQVTVTSASRREERLVGAPASIYVITSDDIRRSGATSLPEALRLAPNLQVMRGDTSQYVVSARGGLTTTANKMLVLVDGRTIYTPLFSGVFYDAVTVVLEDVDRIEVISGPGSTLWGTNAVNGVINVISKPARRTVGGQVAIAAGDQEQGAYARYGWKTPEGAMRVHARYYDRDDQRLASGASAQDAARRGTFGIDGEWERGRDSAQVQAMAYKADVDNLGGAREMSGGHVLGRWRRDLGNKGSLSVQAYIDRTERLHTGTFEETRDTFDVEMQHSFALAAGNRLTWGAGHRASHDDSIATPTLGFLPAERTLNLSSLFAQDEIDLTAATRLTLGVRAERNTYTGVEWLPNVRLSHFIAPEQFVWGALTRAVRSPSRLDRDLVVPGAPPFVLEPSTAYGSEVADVAEVGYRGNLSRRVTFSVTAYHHRFSDLKTLEPVGTALQFANAGRGRISGIETWGDFRATSDWRLLWGFTWLRDSFELEPGRVNFSDNPLGNNPRRTASLRSQWNVTSKLELDVLVRHVDELRDPATPAYTEVGARVGWRAMPGLELSLVVNNALDREHAEFGPTGVRAIFGRSWLARAAWSF